jgi:tRNA A37 N6-isopentenylltransferase MiaA
MIILEENRHTILFIEHDPTLYEDVAEVTEYVSQAMREASKEAAVLLYVPGTESYLEELVKNADMVFYFDKGHW